MNSEGSGDACAVSSDSVSKWIIDRTSSHHAIIYVYMYIRPISITEEKKPIK